MSQPDIKQLTQDALAECKNVTLDRIEAIADATEGLFSKLGPAKALQARLVLAVLRGCVEDERKARASRPKLDSGA